MRMCLIVAFLLFPLITHSQTIEEDVIQLKNGEIYRGTLMETRDTTQVRLKTRAGNELLFPKAEIESIKQHEVSDNLYMTEESLKHFRKSGYTVLGNFGGMVGKNQANDPEVGLHAEVINSYLFNPHLSAGLGMAYHQFSSTFPFSPVFVNVRGNLFKKNFTPYATASGGVSTPLLIKEKHYEQYNEFESGRFYQFGLGIKHFFDYKGAFLMEITYLSDKMSVVSDFDNFIRPDRVKTIHIKNRVTLKIGLQF